MNIRLLSTPELQPARDMGPQAAVDSVWIGPIGTEYLKLSSILFTNQFFADKGKPSLYVHGYPKEAR